MRHKYELLAEGALRYFNVFLRINCLSWFKYLIIHRDKKKKKRAPGIPCRPMIQEMGHNTGESLKIKMFSMSKKDSRCRICILCD